MKANELRVGNYVKGIGHNISWLVDGVDTYYIYSSNAWRLLSSFEGIPLNENWLEKFGFKRSGLYNLKDEVYIYDEYGLIDTGFEYRFNYTQIKLKYVHQLQNLYFALTGEELTINC